MILVITTEDTEGTVGYRSRGKALKWLNIKSNTDAAEKYRRDGDEEGIGHKESIKHRA